jgi:hypothetical protein
MRTTLVRMVFHRTTSIQKHLSLHPERTSIVLTFWSFNFFLLTVVFAAETPS